MTENAGEHGGIANADTVELGFGIGQDIMLGLIEESAPQISKGVIENVAKGLGIFGGLVGIGMAAACAASGKTTSISVPQLR